MTATARLMIGGGGAGRTRTGGEPELEGFGRLLGVVTAAARTMLERDWRDRREREAMAPCVTTCCRFLSARERRGSQQTRRETKGRERTRSTAQRLAHLLLFHVEVLQVPRPVLAQQRVKDLLPRLPARPNSISFRSSPTHANTTHSSESNESMIDSSDAPFQSVLRLTKMSGSMSRDDETGWSICWIVGRT